MHGYFIDADLVVGRPAYRAQGHIAHPPLPLEGELRHVGLGRTSCYVRRQRRSPAITNT